MCLLFFTPLFLRLVPAAAVGGLRPVELPFQILFLGDLALPELLLAELPLLQEIIQQAIPKADRHVLFREIRVGGVCDLVEPGAGIDKLMPPVSHFGGSGRAQKKQGVIDKLKSFFDKFFGIGGGSMAEDKLHGGLGCGRQSTLVRRYQCYV